MFNHHLVSFWIQADHILTDDKIENRNDTKTWTKTSEVVNCAVVPEHCNKSCKCTVPWWTLVKYGMSQYYKLSGCGVLFLHCSFFLVLFYQMSKQMLWWFAIAQKWNTKHEMKNYDLIRVYTYRCIIQEMCHWSGCNTVTLVKDVLEFRIHKDLNSNFKAGNAWKCETTDSFFTLYPIYSLSLFWYDLFLFSHKQF